MQSEIVQVSHLNVPAPVLDDEGDEFSFTFVSGLLQVQAYFVSQLA